MKTRKLTHSEVSSAAFWLTKEIKQLTSGKQRVYGIPRGGVSVAYLIAGPEFELVDKPEDATVFVDDIIDSGLTKKRWNVSYPDTPFLALADYLDPPKLDEEWLVFPWEQGEDDDSSADDIVVRLLQFIGEDVTREGLQETPKRVLSAWKSWCSGYGKDPQEVLKIFEDGSEDYDSMVIVKDLPFYSTCEHHMAPFFGTASIAYLPNKSVAGLSKLSRVLDIFARRLQVQERLTTQVAHALQEHLQPKGVGVVIKARHLCMESRGICKQGHETVTSAVLGNFRTDEKVREEFNALLLV